MSLQAVNIDVFMCAQNKIKFPSTDVAQIGFKVAPAVGKLSEAMMAHFGVVVIQRVVI